MTDQLPPPNLDRPVVGSYPTYEGAQRAVDFLSDNGFPVERTAIIGSDLRMVETVLGRLTRGRAALAGAGSGAWFGLLIGLLLSLFARGSSSALALLLSALAYGSRLRGRLRFHRSRPHRRAARFHLPQPDHRLPLRRRGRPRRGRRSQEHADQAGVARVLNKHTPDMASLASMNRR